MRHFIGYHNAEKMKYSSTTLTEPKLKTGKKVTGLGGATVWLIAGEGASRKDYFIASKFIVTDCDEGLYPGTKHPNQVSGIGALYKLSKPISGTKLLDDIKSETNNFRNGFHEIGSSKLISDLLAAI